jgi:hypothetical protein
VVPVARAHGGEQIERTVEAAAARLRPIGRGRVVSALERLRALLLDEGELMRAALLPRATRARATCAPGPGALAAPARGPRRDRREEYELLSRRSTRATCCTTASPRLSCADARPDLALLAGDRLYALGLERLVALGDLAAVRELADVITLCALARRARRGAAADASGAGRARRRLGRSDEHSAPRRCASPGDPAAIEAMRTSAAALPRRLTILFAPPRYWQEIRWPQARRHKSKYTLDRGSPGAFEGETVTRRRFMTGTAHGAGADRRAGFTLPALGFALGPIFKNDRSGWQIVGTPTTSPTTTTSRS